MCELTSVWVLSREMKLETQVWLRLHRALNAMGGIGSHLRCLWRVPENNWDMVRALLLTGKPGTRPHMYSG